MPGAAQGPLLGATRIRPNESEGVNNASGPQRPRRPAQACAGAAFHHRGVILFEIKGGTKYEFKVDIYSSGEMTYSGKASSLRSWEWAERRKREEDRKPSGLRRPRPAQSWPTSLRALGWGRRGFGAAGKKHQWGCNSLSHPHFRRTGRAGFPWPQGSPKKTAEAEFLPNKFLAPTTLPVELKKFLIVVKYI